MLLPILVLDLEGQRQRDNPAKDVCDVWLGVDMVWSCSFPPSAGKHPGSLADNRTIFHTPSLALSTWGVRGNISHHASPRELANVSGRRVSREPATSRVVCSLWTAVNGDFEEARDAPWLLTRGTGWLVAKIKVRHLSQRLENGAVADQWTSSYRGRQGMRLTDDRFRRPGDINHAAINPYLATFGFRLGARKNC